MIEEAIEFIVSKVHRPALASDLLPIKIKSKITKNKVMIDRFKRVGDLCLYISRFAVDGKSAGGDVFDALTEHGFESLESVSEEFEKRFIYDLNDFTVLDDFVIGETYSSFDIAIFNKSYNVQQGIYPVGMEPNYQAVLIKVKLGEDKEYPNEWIREGVELKYYLKSIDNNFSTEYKANRAIINSQSYPIYVFIKTGTNCVLEGIYQLSEVCTEGDGSKWFRLLKEEFPNSSKTIDSVEITLDAYEADLKRRVFKSLEDSPAKRRARLAVASGKPKKQMIKISGFQRNADVVAEVLLRANGVCESCKAPAPFISRAKDKPYLEVHHIVHLANGGYDTVENALALCPNCHREMHFGVGY